MSTTREAILAEHGLTEYVTVQLPPLRARNHAQAVAVLKATRAALLDHAQHLTFLASAFTDVPEVFDILVADTKAALVQADRCLPRKAAR